MCDLCAWLCELSIVCWWGLKECHKIKISRQNGCLFHNIQPFLINRPLRSMRRRRCGKRGTNAPVFPLRNMFFQLVHQQPSCLTHEENVSFLCGKIKGRSDLAPIDLMLEESSSEETMITIHHSEWRWESKLIFVKVPTMEVWWSGMNFSSRA